MSVMDKKVMQNEMTIVLNRFALSPHTYKVKLFKHEQLLLVDIQDSISYINNNIQLEQMEQMLSVLVMTKFCPNSLIITLGTIAVNI